MLLEEAAVVFLVTLRLRIDMLFLGSLGGSAVPASFSSVLLGLISSPVNNYS